MPIETFKVKILPLRDRLFRMALRLVRDASVAEDVVQDLMLKMWVIRKEWEKIDSLEGYCCRMVYNLSLNKLEKEKVNRTVGIGQVEGMLPQTDTFLQKEQDEQREWLARFIDGLPEKQRQIMLLRETEGLSYREISEVLQVSEEQVKIELFRSRRKAKEYLQKIMKYGTETS